MKREIKFRAWDKRFKNMIFDRPMAILHLNDSDHEIMQFTGLLDKNGKEVYESDIIIETFESPLPMTYDIYEGKVVWWDSGWFIDTKEYDTVSLTDSALELEVIGSIHENPELLKDK